MDILNTIIPIFAIISLGWVARQRQFLPEYFIGAANRLVFYFAIPAMIFRAIARSSFHERFNADVLFIGLFSMTAAYLLAWGLGWLLKLEKGRVGTFVQSSFHCNIGYMAFAVSYYFLGSDGFARAGMFAGFIIILQNFFSVIILSINNDKFKGKRIGLVLITQIMFNPVIIASATGIFFSLYSITLPVIITRSLDILGGMGLPMALLIIGASLSFHTMKTHITLVAVTSFIKLILLPGFAFTICYLTHISRVEYLPLLIILASPTATITYVMAGEMNGDKDFAAAAISINTVISALTFIFWLNLA
ncbi:MAG: AEC family transporter [Proteobacteria bacterium]|nr:AEC family transporter [Pseudomonadota bacterium]